MEAALEASLLTVQMRELIPRDVTKLFQSHTQKPKNHSLALSSILFPLGMLYFGYRILILIILKVFPIRNMYYIAVNFQSCEFFKCALLMHYYF